MELPARARHRVHHRNALPTATDRVHAEIASACFETPIAPSHLRRTSGLCNVTTARRAGGHGNGKTSASVLVPSQLSPTPRSCVIARRRGRALIDVASETTEDAIAKVSRLECLRSRDSSHLRYFSKPAANGSPRGPPRVSGPVAVSGGYGSAWFHARMMDPHLVPVDPQQEQAEGVREGSLVN